MTNVTTQDQNRRLWSQEEKALLIKLGEERQQISYQLDQIRQIRPWTTKNSLLGERHRLIKAGLLSQSATLRHEHFNKRKSQAKKEKKAAMPEKGNPVSLSAPHDLQFSVHPDHRKTLDDLNDDSCRWPYGDPREKTFHFCHCKKVPGKSYCESHLAASIRPKDEKKFIIGFKLRSWQL